MAEYMIQDETLTNIADAIRAKTGNAASMTPLEMISAILGLNTGGGLPDGISALAGGTCTKTSSDSNISLTVAHGLGVTPNFYICVPEEDYSEAAGKSCLTYSMAICKKIKKNNTTSDIYYVNGVVGGYTTGSSHSYNSINKTSQSNFNETTVIMEASSYYPWIQGVTYRWVCGVLDGIQ